MAREILIILIEVIIFILMLSFGVSQSFDELQSLWRRPGWLLRSLLAVVVIFPLLVFALLKLLDLPSGVAAGLVILASAPGAPVTYKRSALAGGQPTYTAGLHVTLAILAIVITPSLLLIFYSLYDFSDFKFKKQVFYSEG